MLDELGHPVQGKPGLEITKIARPYLEGLVSCGGASACKPAAQRVVDDLAKRPPRAARLCPELCRHVVVQGERGAHAVMLQPRHHDVKPPPFPAVDQCVRTVMIA